MSLIGGWEPRRLVAVAIVAALIAGPVWLLNLREDARLSRYAIQGDGERAVAFSERQWREAPSLRPGLAHAIIDLPPYEVRRILGRPTQGGGRWSGDVSDALFLRSWEVELNPDGSRSGGGEAALREWVFLVSTASTVVFIASGALALVLILRRHNRRMRARVATG